MSFKKFSPFCSASRAIIWVKVHNRQTDKQTNSLTPYTGVCGFFLSVKFSTSLLALLPGGLKFCCQFFHLPTCILLISLLWLVSPENDDKILRKKFRSKKLGVQFLKDFSGVFKLLNKF